MRRSLEVVPVALDSVKLARNVYRQDYQKSLNAYNQTMKSLPERFLGKELADRRATAKKQFDKKVEELKNAFTDEIVKATSEIETAIESEVKQAFVPSPVTSLIEHNLHVSKTEFQILYDRYNGDSYWSTKAFQQLASANGLDVNLPGDADTILNVLQQIRSEADVFLTEWAGDQESSIKARMQLTDHKLSRWESECLTGYTANLSPEQRASRALQAVVESGTAPAPRIFAINNILRNLADDEDTKQLFLYGLATDDHLYNVAIVPFLEQTYQDVIRQYHDGKRPAPEVKPKEEESDEYKLSDSEKEVVQALNQLAQKKAEVQAENRARIVANMSKESAPAAE